MERDRGALTETPIVRSPVDVVPGARFPGPAIEKRLAATNSFRRAPLRSDTAGKTQALYYRPQHDDNANI
jgi:hypothetical protein